MRWFVFITLICINFFIWFKIDMLSLLSGRGDFWDAKNYLQTISDIKKGQSPYEISYMQTLGPPLVILPYVPISFFPEKVALTLFTVISVVAGYLSCFLLARKYWSGNLIQEKTLILGGVLYSAFPTRFNFITGQWGLVNVLLLTVLLTATSKKVSGVMIGLLIVLKTNFAFVLLGLRSKKIIAWALFTLASFLIISMPLFKPTHYLEYRERFAGVMWQSDNIIDVAYYSQSLKTTLSRLGLVEYSVTLWIGVAVLAGLYCSWSKNFWAAAIFSLVLSPVAWQHYYVILFPFLVMSFSFIKNKPKWLLVWLASLCLWWLEFPWLHQQSVTIWSGLLASHYVFSALFLCAVIIYEHHQNKKFAIVEL
jgi:hypothetical protein